MTSYAPAYTEPPDASGYAADSSAPSLNYGRDPQNTVQGTPLYGNTSNAELTRRFVYRGYQDVWAAVLFVLQLLVTLIWAIVNGSRSSSSDAESSTNSSAPPQDGNTTAPPDAATLLRESLVYGVLMGLVLSALLAGLSLGLMRAFPRQYIWGANLLSILLLAIFSFVLLGHHLWAGGIVMLLFTLFVWLLFWLTRRRIPFAALLLQNSVTTVIRHHGTVVVSGLSLVALFVYQVMFAAMAIPTVARTDRGAAYTVAVLFFLLMWFWTCQVFINVVHVTASGTVATWYFVGASSMPPNPSVASAKRALTTSFGSICFASLVVALLKLLHTVLRYAARERTGVLAFVALVAMCCIGLLERLMEYFNIYALTHVAIYGSSFIEAAKQTWALAKACAFAAVFNDNLVYPVLNLTTLANSLVIGIVVGLLSNGLIGTEAFLVSCVIHFVVLRVVYSGVVTIFVCYAECPESLERTNPELHAAVETAAEVASTSTC